jgi:hypothetical protein
VKLSKAQKPTGLLGAHVVIAVAEMDYGTASLALRAMGLDRQELIEAARPEIEALLH